MGTLKKGILGGFSGKVGNVVGASWKGIDYIRSLPASVKNPRTQGQVTQRTKFSTTMEFLKTLTPIIREGFKADAVGKVTAMNAAMSYNVKNAIKGDFPDFEVDFEKAIIARGSLYGTDSASATAEAGKLNFDWDLTILNNASLSDDVVFVVYNPTRREALYNEKGSTRMEGYGSFDIPALWAGDTVQTYIIFKSQDGKLNSNSIYTGSVEVVLV